jgi:hypothetical protein
MKGSFGIPFYKFESEQFSSRRVYEISVSFFKGFCVIGYTNVNISSVPTGSLFYFLTEVFYGWGLLVQVCWQFVSHLARYS